MSKKLGVVCLGLALATGAFAQDATLTLSDASGNVKATESWTATTRGERQLYERVSLAAAQIEESIIIGPCEGCEGPGGGGGMPIEQVCLQLWSVFAKGDVIERTASEGDRLDLKFHGSPLITCGIGLPGGGSIRENGPDNNSIHSCYPDHGNTDADMAGAYYCE